MPAERAASDTPSAVSLRLEALTKRADFLRAARAPQVAMPGFILQMRTWHRTRHRPACRLYLFEEGRQRGGTQPCQAAAARNCASLALHGVRDADYVLIGRRGGDSRPPFAQLQRDLRKALQQLARPERHDPAGPILALPVRAYRLVFSPGSVTTAAISRPAAPMRWRRLKSMAGSKGLAGRPPDRAVPSLGGSGYDPVPGDTRAKPD